MEDVEDSRRTKRAVQMTLANFRAVLHVNNSLVHRSLSEPILAIVSHLVAIFNHVKKHRNITMSYLQTWLVYYSLCNQLSHDYTINY